jgi:hypothetical protein
MELLVNFMMTSCLIAVWAELVGWVLSRFILVFEPSAHWLKGALAIAADEELILSSACFVLMGSVIHAVRRMLTQHISPQSSIIAFQGFDRDDNSILTATKGLTCLSLG